MFFGKSNIICIRSVLSTFHRYSPKCNDCRLFSGQSSAAPISVGTKKETHYERRKEKAKPKLDSFADRLDKKLTKWKIMQVLFESPSEIPKDWRLIYAYTNIRRTTLARAILYGYFLFGVEVVALITNSNGITDACVHHFPWPCAMFFPMILSYSIYISYVCRTLVVDIYVRDSVKALRSRGLKGKSSPPEFVLTRVRPLSGVAERVEFDANDVYMLDDVEIKSWPLWRRIWHYVNPASPTARIKDRWFTVLPRNFIDGELRQYLSSSSQELHVRPVFKK